MKPFACNFFRPQRYNTVITCMISHTYILVNKRNDTKIFLKYIVMLKPKQFFIIIYINICVKRVYPHKAYTNILFRYGKIPETKLSVP